MCTTWDGEEPRAVVPPKSVVNAPHVLAATPMMAQKSPYGFGIGISTMSNHVAEGSDSDSDDQPEDIVARTALPLFYVSKVVAKERPEEVKHEWYVIADPGKPFEVTISPVKGYNSVKNTVASADLITTRLQVDGSFTEDAVKIFAHGASEEGIYSGFTQSVRSFGNSMSRESKIRRFQFYKAPTTADEVQTKLSPRAGQIRLHMESGNFGAINKVSRKKSPMKPVGKKRTRANSLGEAAEVHEKSAVKWGLSVGVRQDGAEVVTVTQDVGRKIQKRKKLPHIITIYVRERFWLESRRIINRDGKPYRPPLRNLDAVAAPTAIVDLSGQEENAEAKSEVKLEVKTEANIFLPGEVIDLCSESDS